MAEKQVENILILGNGFDLAMGRSTSYKDFLNFLDTIRIFMEYEFKEEDFKNAQYSKFLGIEAEIDEKRKQEFIKRLNKFRDDIKKCESYFKEYVLEAVYKHPIDIDIIKSTVEKYISFRLKYIDESIVNRIYNAVDDFYNAPIYSVVYYAPNYNDVLDKLDDYLEEASLSDKILFLYDVIPEIHDLEEFQKRVIISKYVSFEFDLKKSTVWYTKKKNLKIRLIHIDTGLSFLVSMLI